MNKSLIKTSDSIATRVQNAKQFLLENPKECIVCAARIFNLAETTLYSSIEREKTPPKKTGGQNKILEEHQVRAIHEFIRSLIAYGIQPTHKVVLAAITTLKRAQDAEFNGPSPRWFRQWWKDNGLHKIKTKPLAVVRYTAAQESDVRSWFDRYQRVLAELGITRSQDIWNFDEAGFRVGCMKGHEILVPSDIKEFYSISPENRKYLTIIESINAAGHQPPPRFNHARS